MVDKSLWPRNVAGITVPKGGFESIQGDLAGLEWLPPCSHEMELIDAIFVSPTLAGEAVFADNARWSHSPYETGIL